MGGFWSKPTFVPSRDIPSLSGRVIIITGANNGLGYETMVQLAQHSPQRIYLCARNRAKFDDALTRLTALVPDATSFVRYLELDLSSLAAVKAATEAFLRQESRLDILFNNAGIMAGDPALTVDGYEIRFGTNHMGHALFTKLLLPLLRQTAAQTGSDVRIVNISSDGYRTAPKPTGFVPEICTTDMATYNVWTRYGQSKLANILFARELGVRCPEILSVSLHPGSVNTGMVQSFIKNYPIAAFFLRPLWNLVSVDAAHGAYTQLWAAVAPIKGKGKGKVKAKANGMSGNAATIPEVENGAYYTPVAKLTHPGHFAAATAANKDLSRKLWEWTETEFEKKGY
jgi:NAD(P)-dependent dehydrogenase (short-subunit alcohol dehydrogenase family)